MNDKMNWLPTVQEAIAAEIGKEFDSLEAESTALTDLEVVCKLMQAYQLLGEVFQHESPMILNLMPECTELFLEQASLNFVELHKRMSED